MADFDTDSDGMPDEQTPTTKTLVLEDIQNRQRWVEKQKQIKQRARGARPKRKQFPYPGAPNYIEPIVEDVTREKVEQEITMWWNAPLLFHAYPLEEVPQNERTLIQQAMDGYFRYIIKARQTVDTALWDKNLGGIAIMKQVRKWSPVMRQIVPDFEVRGMLDVIYPVDTTDLADAERITDVLRLTEDQFRKMAAQKGWKNVDQVVMASKRHERSDFSGDDGDADELATVQDQVGITTSGINTPYVVIWEVYRKARKKDVEQMDEAAFEVGDRMLEVMSPDDPTIEISRIPWREEEIFFADGAVFAPEREWPFVAARYEYKSRYLLDTRGIGEQSMDDQIEATAMRNAKGVFLDYFAKPMFTGGVGTQNSLNFTAKPGSFIPNGMQPAMMPEVPRQFDLDVNAARMRAGRRAGATSQFNTSSQPTSQNQSTKPKSATEIESENAKASLITSSAVERFNEPFAEMAQLIWKDMARMRLIFPVIAQGQESILTDESIYSRRMLLVPASSSKSINPDIQLSRIMALISQLSALAQFGVPLNFTQMVKDALANYDPLLTQNWVVDGQGGVPFHQVLQQLQQDVQQLAAGGQGLQDNLENVMKLAVENNDKVESVQEQQQVQVA